MLVRYQKLQRLDYFDFASENFSLVRFGSEENYPETVFSNLEILFIVFLHIAVVNSPSSIVSLGVMDIWFCGEHRATTKRVATVTAAATSSKGVGAGFPGHKQCL